MVSKKKKLKSINDVVWEKLSRGTSFAKRPFNFMIGHTHMMERGKVELETTVAFFLSSYGRASTGTKQATIATWT